MKLTEFFVRCLALVLFLASAASQASEEAPAGAVAKIKKEAEACANALLKLDFDKFIPYMPGKLVELMGGKDTIIRSMTEGTKEMKRDGIGFKSVEIGAPGEPERHGDLEVTLVPMKLVMTTPQGDLVTRSHMLAVSENQGADWDFVDCATLTDEHLEVLYPALAGKIAIPKAQRELPE